MIQRHALMRHFPDASCTVRRDELVWVAALTPTPVSREYVVRLSYKLTDFPEVELLDPEMETRDGLKPPHLYPGDKLCLYRPGWGEWDRTMLLVETIVPWTAEWLMHYEIWLATGEWHGGGDHPPSKPRSERTGSPEPINQRPRK